MNRWLTLFDVCAELRLGSRAVRGMIRRGQLFGYRLPRRGRNKWGEWRILDPSTKFARYVEESRRHIEHVPLLSTCEVAELLAVTPSAVRQLKRRRRLRGTKVGMTTLYTVAEIRGFLFRRERRTRRGKRTMYSPILVAWARRLAQQDENVGVQVLDSLLRQSVAIPEPAKYIVEVWAHFDAINSLLRSARLGEDLAHCVKKAGTAHSVPEPRLTELSAVANFLKTNLAPAKRT